MIRRSTWKCEELFHGEPNIIKDINLSYLWWAGLTLVLQLFTNQQNITSVQTHSIYTWQLEKRSTRYIRLENIVGRGKKLLVTSISPFPQCFQRTSLTQVLKLMIVWYKTKVMQYILHTCLNTWTTIPRLWGSICVYRFLWCVTHKCNWNAK